MVDSPAPKFSAAEQSLGYIYQPRLALLRTLQLPEESTVFIEKDDDLDFVEVGGVRSLSSLKHKANADRLTDLSRDFWKSVRIWLHRYEGEGRLTSSLRFYLFTTGEVANDSFLRSLTTPRDSTAAADLAGTAMSVLATSKAGDIQQIAAKFKTLSESELEDFLERITIFDRSPRIDDIPGLIKDGYMRTIRRDHRDPIFHRLEGWWNERVIAQLTGRRPEGIVGLEVSDALSAISDEYKSDNLPITWRGKEPPEGIDTVSDPRLFVVQLREIGLSSHRIRSAILDYYRAFEQRSAWAREHLVLSSQIQEYEDRLTDEWERYKDVAFENLDDESAEDALRKAGSLLYNWAEFETGKLDSLRIRARVTEPFVLRGSFHILADARPEPRIYWHPRFLERIGTLLGVMQ